MRHTKIIWFFFFFSGLAGLSYELIWLRYLTKIFGATTPAVSATVAIFFVGLALGAALGARFFAKRLRPLQSYGVLEICIGVMALLVPWMFSVAEQWLLHLPEGSETLGTLLLTSGVLLLLPTTLLGATFPAMAAVVQHQGNTTRHTGLFYGLNTLGAVLGCLLVSFWALPALGQRETTWLMAVLNLLIGSICLMMGRNAPIQQTPTPEAALTQEAPSPDQALPSTNLGRKSAYGLALVSGFCAIGIEVLWSRALALSVAGSVYIFALILAAYLTGIGIGSLWISAMHRKAPPRRSWLALLYLAACLGTLLTIFFFPKLLPATLGLLKRGQLSGYTQYLGWVGGAAVAMMLPATIAIGAALPLLIGVATASDKDATTLAGRLYGTNTLGGVAGSLCATFLIMPGIGLTPSIALLAGIYMLLAFVAIGRQLRQSSRTFVIVGALGILASFLVLERVDDINPQKHRHDEKLLYHQDTPSGTIAIHENQRGTRILRVNNYYGLSRTNAATRRMQYRLGLLPLLLHPRPKRSLLIGFATGTTLAAMALHPQARRVICIELHAQIPQLAPFFAGANHAVWKHPKVQIHQADGRRYLLRHRALFDVIVGDLYLPRNPGVGALYSVEHFQAAKQKLAKGGHFVAWLPGFQLGPQELKSIIKAFLVAFPKAEGWLPHWNANIPIIGLVGSKDGPITAPPQLAETMQQGVKVLMSKPIHPVALQEWQKQVLAQASRPPQPSALRLISNQILKRWAVGAKANRLEHPLIEYATPRTGMNARIKGFPLAAQVLLMMGQSGILQKTPWQSHYQTLLRKHPAATHPIAQKP